MIEKFSDDKSTLLWNPLLVVLVIDKSHTKPGLIAFRPLKIAKGMMSVKIDAFFLHSPMQWTYSIKLHAIYIFTFTPSIATASAIAAT
jgi:hypothetical protein